jgi:hypothetical protein
LRRVRREWLRYLFHEKSRRSRLALRSYAHGRVGVMHGILIRTISCFRGKLDLPGEVVQIIAIRQFVLTTSSARHKDTRMRCDIRSYKSHHECNGGPCQWGPQEIETKVCLKSFIRSSSLSFMVRKLMMTFSPGTLPEQQCTQSQIRAMPHTSFHV